MESSTASKNARTKAKKQEVLLRWSFPPNGWYKLNVDGTFRGRSGTASGGVIRNENGEWVSGFAANDGMGKKSIEAELCALYKGLELAYGSGWAPIVVESDSEAALNLLLDPIEKNLKHRHFDLIKGCQNLLNQMWSYSLNHVYREQNSVADCLASFGLNLEMGCHYFDNPPPLCHSFLVQDQCRVARPRSLLPSAIERRRIRKLRDVEEEEDLKKVVFTLKIHNFSKLGVDKHYSDIFVIGVFQWRILVHPRGNSVDGLSVYLDVTGSSTLPSGWARYVKFSLAVVNQLESNKSISKDTEHLFTKMDSCTGFTSLIPLSELSDSSKGYLVNDTCIVEAKVAVHKAEIKILKEQTRSSAAPIRASPPQNRRRGQRPKVAVHKAEIKILKEQTRSSAASIRASPPQNRRRGRRGGRKGSFRLANCRPSKFAQVVSTAKLKVEAMARAKRPRRRADKKSREDKEGREDQIGGENEVAREAKEAQIVTLISPRRQQTKSPAGKSKSENRPHPRLVRSKTQCWKQINKVSVDFGSDFTNQISDFFSGGDALRPSDKECTTSGPPNVQAQSKCTSSQICAKTTEIRDAPPMVKEHEDASSTPDGELMDFRGLGKIQKTFVPLLDEVCSWHPSLIECQRKRSRMFSEWAFTSLGRLLHFLKMGKVKDMTHDTSVQHLLLLWEELEAFGFDLAWLKPCVQRALRTKEMAERAGQLRRMREDVDALQSQTKTLRAALDVAEANLEAAIRTLDKNQQDFHEVDMDAGLWDGYVTFL